MHSANCTFLIFYTRYIGAKAAVPTEEHIDVVSPTTPETKERELTILRHAQEIQGSPSITEGSLNIIYFIVGAAVESTFALAEEYLSNAPGYDEKMKADLMEKLYSGLVYENGAEEAKSNDLPYKLVEKRSRKNLLYPVLAIFNIFLSMEQQVLGPLLMNSRFLACLGNFFPVYVERELQARGFPEALIAEIEIALDFTPNDTHDGDEINYFPRILAEKMFRYYCGSTLNDFVRHIGRALKHDQDFQKSVSFRQLLLTKKLEKQLTCEKDKAKAKKKSEKKKKNKANKKASSSSAASSASGTGSVVVAVAEKASG